MGRLSEILTSPRLLLVLCTFLKASGHIGMIKTIGIYLEDINISLGTTSTDIGIALGLLSAFSNFPAPIIAGLYHHHFIRRLLLISGTCLAPMGVALTSMATNNAQIAIYLSITGTIADQFSSYDATFKLLAFTDVVVLLLIVVVRYRPNANCT